MVSQQHSHGDRWLEALVLGGFLLAILATLIFEVPRSNEQLVASLMATWGAVALLVAKSLWERGAPNQVATPQGEPFAMVRPPDPTSLEPASDGPAASLTPIAPTGDDEPRSPTGVAGGQPPVPEAPSWQH